MEPKDKIEGEFEVLINKFVKEKFVEEILTKCPYCNKIFTITVPVDSIAITKSINEFKTFIKHMLNIAKQEFPKFEQVDISNMTWEEVARFMEKRNIEREEWFKKWFGEK